MKNELEILPNEIPVVLSVWGLKVGDMDEPRTAVKLAYRSEIVRQTTPAVKYFLAKSNRNILGDIIRIQQRLPKTAAEPMRDVWFGDDFKYEKS